MTIYTWPDPGQEESNITGSRLADQMKALGIPSYAYDTARDAALAEMLVDRIEGGAFDVRAYGAVADGVTDALEAFQDADAAASAAGGYVMVPAGEFSLSGTFTPTCGRIVMHGQILAGADITPLRIGSNCDIITDEQSTDVGVASGVTHTSTLVLVQARLHVVGTLVARGAGSHGIHFRMDSGDNLNWTRGSFRGTQCGGDGVRAENNTAGTGNLNAWDVGLRGDSCNVGVRVLDGIGGKYHTRTDNCTSEGVIFGGGNEGVFDAFVLCYDDSSNGAISVFQGAATEGGQVFGLFNSGIPFQDASWMIVNRNSFHGRSTSDAIAFRFGNASANDNSEWADVELFAASSVGASGVIGRIRARGDAFVLLQDIADLQINPTRLGFYGTTPAAQQSDPGTLTDSSGGSTDGTVAAVSGSGADSDINNNFAELVDRVNALSLALRNLGLIA